MGSQQFFFLNCVALFLHVNYRHEGAGRSLSLKLIEQLRVQTRPMGRNAKDKEIDAKLLGRSLAEVFYFQQFKLNHTLRYSWQVSLNESIRYRNGDAIEGWLNHLLCLDASLAPPIPTGCPSPENCDLYYVDR